jgi:hypothetical protein
VRYKLWLTVVDVDEFTGSGNLGEVHLRLQTNDQTATEKQSGKNVSQSLDSDRNHGGPTDVIQIHDLIIANLGVL